MNRKGQIVASGSKGPVERRRRNNNAGQSVLGSSSTDAVPLRRESDQIRARMRRWIDLADKALGKLPAKADHLDSSG